MENIVRELEIQGKSVAVIETRNTKVFSEAMDKTNIPYEKAKVTRSTVTNPKFKNLLPKRQDIVRTYPEDSVEKAEAMSVLASRSTGANYGIGICGSTKVGSIAYLCVYDRESTITYKVRVPFDLSRTQEKNKQYIMYMITVKLNSLLKSSKTKKLVRK